jgi:hypothetical protein
LLSEVDGGVGPWLEVIFWERFRRITRLYKEPAVPERLGNAIGEQKLGVFSISSQSYILHDRTQEILFGTQLQNTSDSRELQLYNLAKHFTMLPILIGKEEGWYLKSLWAGI